MRHLVLHVAVGLLAGLAAASVSLAQEPPLVWEIVGEPLDAFDLWPDALDVFVTDTAAYANGGEGLFVIRPGETEWTLLVENFLPQGVYATSTGVLFIIADALSRSTDGGYTFEGVLEDADAVLELPSGLLVATENACCGIARSTDDGANWTLIDLGDDITPAYVPRALAYAPPSPNRSEARLVTVGRDGAAYSTDEGLTWHPSNLVEPFGFDSENVIYSAHDDSLYAMINGDPGDGGVGTGLVWASARGEVWELRGRVPTGGDESPGQIVVGEEGTLWAIIPGDIDGTVYASGDGGRTWVDRGAVEGEPLVGNPLRSKRLRMGPDGRLWMGAIRGEATQEATGAVLRTVEPVAVASEEGPGKPTESVLGAAYPNPSRGNVTVPLLPAEASDVRVVVYDVLGRQVAVLAEGRVDTGRHTFTLDGGVLPAGLYVVRATVRTDSGVVQAFSRRVSIVR